MCIFPGNFIVVLSLMLSQAMKNNWWQSASYNLIILEKQEINFLLVEIFQSEY